MGRTVRVFFLVALLLFGVVGSSFAASANERAEAIALSSPVIKFYREQFQAQGLTLSARNLVSQANENNPRYYNVALYSRSGDKASVVQLVVDLKTKAVIHDHSFTVALRNGEADKDSLTYQDSTGRKGKVNKESRVTPGTPDGGGVTTTNFGACFWGEIVHCAWESYVWGFFGPWGAAIGGLICAIGWEWVCP